MISKAIQLVVPLTNKPGTMSKLCIALGKEGINIIAINVTDEKREQRARVMVSTDDLDDARDFFRRKRIQFSEEDVLDIEMDNRPGAFGELSGKLARAGINIKHAYATTAPFARARVIFSVSDVPKALEILNR